MIKFSDINLISDSIETEKIYLNSILDTQLSLNKEILSVMKNFFISVDVSIPTTYNSIAFKYIANLKNYLSISDNNIESINSLIKTLTELSEQLSSLSEKSIKQKISEYNSDFSTKTEPIFTNTTEIQSFIHTISIFQNETSCGESNIKPDIESTTEKTKKNKKERKAIKKAKIQEKNKQRLSKHPIAISKKEENIETENEINSNVDLNQEDINLPSEEIQLCENITNIEETLNPPEQLSTDTEQKEINIETIIENPSEEINFEEKASEESSSTVDTVNISTEEVIDNNSTDSKYTENVLIISEMQEKVFLPYKLNDVSQILLENMDKYTSIDDVIEKEYTVPYERYKFSAISRFKEAYTLVKNNNGSFLKAFSLASELFSNFNLHPAIITACKNLDELDIYLACLEDNVLDEFDIFDIQFEIRPIIKNSVNLL